MINEWVINKLEKVTDYNLVIFQDPFGLTLKLINELHTWGVKNKFSILPAATNLIFRWKYEEAKKGENIKKILIIDQTPLSRISMSGTKAVALFYPDIISSCKKEAIFKLDLKEYLIERSKDENWPNLVNDYKYSNFIRDNIENVIIAHKNLRISNKTRFTDNDFKTIVAYSVLGIPQEAFRKLELNDYWKIGLIRHSRFNELERLLPEVILMLKSELKNAPAPFSFFAEHQPELVMRVFYLTLILSQHTLDWKLLLPNIDPTLKPFIDININDIRTSAPKIIEHDYEQALVDIKYVEANLSKDAIKFLMIEYFKIDSEEIPLNILQKEHYSTLIKSFALLKIISNISKGLKITDIDNKAYDLLFKTNHAGYDFIEKNPPQYWLNLKELFKLIYDTISLSYKLENFIRIVNINTDNSITFESFWKLWNEDKINRMEYLLSLLERLLYNMELLPIDFYNIPKYFDELIDNIKDKYKILETRIIKNLDLLNEKYQELIYREYPKWTDNKLKISYLKPCLTSQFIEKCLKPNWDIVNEKAVIMIFDGMRYDIWDELLKPLLSVKIDFVTELPAISLIPSETHLSRKAISAGLFPDMFDEKEGENKLLAKALKKHFNIESEIKIINPESSGIGETVRYGTKNLDVYIFELCDKELHKIKIKNLPDGREVTTRPLSFIYQQSIKNIIENEVMSIIKKLEPDTKIFITSDHGFGRVGRKPLQIDIQELNEPSDCSYLNCWLKNTFEDSNLNSKTKDKSISFIPEQLKLPANETRKEKKSFNVFHKEFKSIIFPKVGFAYIRPNSNFTPDAYSHGGISLQEMIIPMMVYRVKSREENILSVNIKDIPTEVVEGEKLSFSLVFKLSDQLKDLICNVEFYYDIENDKSQKQTILVENNNLEHNISLTPDCEDATTEERQKGYMRRDLMIIVIYKINNKSIRLTLSKNYSVKLNTEKIIRRTGNLGKILGLSPKK